MPFLDVLVTHDNYTFSTSSYRKKTFTGLHTDFSSLAPTKYKINLIRVLVYRAFHICSSYRNFHEEIVRIKKIMTENCFPRSLIDRIIKKFLDRQFKPNPLKEADNKVLLLFCIPFLGQYSLQIKARLGRIIKKCYPSIQLRVIFRSPKRIGSLFPNKDKKCKTKTRPYFQTRSEPRSSFRLECGLKLREMDNHYGALHSPYASRGNYFKLENLFKSC